MLLVIITSLEAMISILLIYLFICSNITQKGNERIAMKLGGWVRGGKRNN